MKEQWQKLNPKEQKLLLVMAAVIGIFIFYSFIWQPLNSGIVKAEKKLASQQELLLWVHEKTSIVKASNQSGRSNKRQGSLSSIVNTTAQQNNIAITRIQPQGDNIQVWIDEAVLDRFLPWIEQLAIVEGLQVVSVDLSATDRPGVVNVRRLQLGKK